MKGRQAGRVLGLARRTEDTAGKASAGCSMMPLQSSPRPTLPRLTRNLRLRTLRLDKDTNSSMPTAWPCRAMLSNFQFHIRPGKGIPQDRLARMEDTRRPVSARPRPRPLSLSTKDTLIPISPNLTRNTQILTSRRILHCHLNMLNISFPTLRSTPKCRYYRPNPRHDECRMIRRLFLTLTRRSRRASPRLVR